MLNDEQWIKLYSILLETGRIYNKKDHRKTVEGILYRMRVGCPWRDLPEYFGDWSAVFRRFNLWSKKGILLQLFNSLAKEPDTEWEFIDGSIVKAHQHSAGAASASTEAIGKSRGGLTTKIHMAVDSYGLPIHFMLTGGEVHGSKIAESLIDKLPKADYLIADKGYDSEAICNKAREKGSVPMIPRKSNSKTGNEDMDGGL
jgi:transposase